MKKKYRPFLINSSLLGIGLFLGVLLVEIILRLFNVSAPHFYTYDDILGHRLIAGAEGWYRQEGEAYIRINRDGWRDLEHSLKKPPNTLRIAVLGDSYTEAKQVPLEKTYWKLMEQNLKSCKAFEKKNIEVLNFGISGNGTDQSYLTLQHYVWQYEPDIILLAFFSGNDIRNNSKVLESKKWKPFFVFREGELVLDNSFLHDPVYQWKSGIWWSFRLFLFRYSRVHQLLSLAQKRYHAYKAQKNSNVEGKEIGLDAVIYAESTEPQWQEAWQITEEILLKMKETIQREDASFLIVTLSNGIQIHPDSKLRQRFIEQHHLLDLFYPEKRMQKFATKHGIELLTLAQPLQQYAEEEQVFLHGFENSELGFGHWNARGHQIAGQLIANYLCQSAR